MKKYTQLKLLVLTSICLFGLIQCTNDAKDETLNEQETSDSNQDDNGDINSTFNDHYIGSTTKYSRTGEIVFDIPSDTRSGDLLVLFLSRTDSYLPLKKDGWSVMGSCFKTKNGQSECHVVSDCITSDGEYCEQFLTNGFEGNGKDLATIVFYKEVTTNEGSVHFDIKTGTNQKESWGILVTLRNMDNDNPIRDFNNRSNDKSLYSVFPSLHGEKGDLLLLSMAFDDAFSGTDKEQNFRPPSGMEDINWLSGNDEAARVYGQLLTASGEVGEKITSTPVQSNSEGKKPKDALIALTLRTK